MMHNIRRENIVQINLISNTILKLILVRLVFIMVLCVSVTLETHVLFAQKNDKICLDRKNTLQYATPQITSNSDSLLSAADEGFIIALFPDIQNEVQYLPKIWESEPNWVAKNSIDSNIVATIGLGDNTNQPTDVQMTEAMKGWNIVDSTGIPYAICIGNHDYDASIAYSGQVGSRSAVHYNSYFGVDRYKGKSWFQGSFQDSSQNYYIKFDIGNEQFLIMSLEFYPRDTVIQWAKNIIGANLSAEVIIATHSYLDSLGHRVLHQERGGPNSYGLNHDNDAQQLWDKLIKLFPNIFLIVGGHMGGLPPNSAFSTDTGINGNIVNQLFVNYQSITNGGNGFMELLKICPAAKKIYAYAYSDWLKQYDSTGFYQMNWDVDSSFVPIPCTPVLQNPKYSQNIFSDPKLTWTKSLFAKKYRVQISIDSLFVNIIKDTIVYQNSDSIDVPLVVNNIYYWRINAINQYGSSPYSDIGCFVKKQDTFIDNSSNLPMRFQLLQNYPNPFNPSTTISFYVPIESNVIIKIYSLLGDNVATLIDGIQNVGTYSISWNASQQPSGVYFCEIKAYPINNKIQCIYTETRKMLLLK